MYYTFAPLKCRLYNPEIAKGDFSDIKGVYRLQSDSCQSTHKERPPLGGRFKCAMV